MLYNFFVSQPGRLRCRGGAPNALEVVQLFAHLLQAKREDSTTAKTSRNVANKTAASPRQSSNFLRFWLLDTGRSVLADQLVNQNLEVALERREDDDV